MGYVTRAPGRVLELNSPQRDDGMLRIETTYRTDSRVRLALVGRLGADSVGTVDGLVSEALSQGLALSLDLGGVSSVAREALGPLAAWRARSVLVEALPGYVEAWLAAEEAVAGTGAPGGGTAHRKGSRAGRTLLALFALPALLLGSPLLGETVRLTRAEAVRRALEDGTAARIAGERVEEARARADEAHAPLMPRVGARLDQSNQTLDLETFGFSLPGQRIIPPFNVTNLQVQAAMNVVDLAARARWEAARQGIAVSRAAREKTDSDVAAAVSVLYTSLLEAEATVASHEANLALFGKLRDLAEHQRSAGVGTKIDVTRALVQLSRERQALVASREAREATRIALLHATGSDQGSEVALADELKVPDAPPPVAVALAASEGRPELRLAEERIAAAGLSGKAARAERLPVLSLQAQGGFSGNDVADLKWTRGIGAFLSVPIFTGGLVDARVAEARIRVRQMETERTEARRQVEAEVRRALVALETSRSRVVLADESLSLATEELEVAEDRYRAGVAPSIEVDNAQTSFAAARQDRVAAVARAARAGIELERATGAIRDLVRHNESKGN